MGLLQTVVSAQNLIGSASNAVSGVRKLASALSTGYNNEPGGVLSAIRSANLPEAGEVIGDLISAADAVFGGDVNPADWRVRLSLANWTSFKGSPVLQPLKDAGGLIFPYTPTISMSSAATYNKIETTHTNYTFQAFKNTEPGAITIAAPMNVEDATQGLYWIAAVHYLRSLTKMFAGTDPKAGNPPPIVFLNGYGNYVFKNVPVVVTGFQTSLDASCDYIGVNVVGSMAGEIEGITQSVGGLAGALGSAIPDISSITGAVSNIAGAIGSVAGIAGSLGLTGTTSGGVTHVPTKSSFTINLQPIYSRESAKNFSLDRFVGGGYLNNSFGYI